MTKSNKAGRKSGGNFKDDTLIEEMPRGKMTNGETTTSAAGEMGEMPSGQMAMTEAGNTGGMPSGQMAMTEAGNTGEMPSGPMAMAETGNIGEMPLGPMTGAEQAGQSSTIEVTGTWRLMISLTSLKG